MFSDTWHRESEVDPDQRAAFLIETSDPTDPKLIQLLVHRYAQDLARLAHFTLADGADGSPSERELLECTARAFVEALTRKSEFWGYESPRTWLFHHLTRACKKPLWRRIARRISGAGNFPPARIPSDTGAASPSRTRAPGSPWPQIHSLGRDQRAVVTLYFGFRLPMAQIGQVMRSDASKMRGFLATALVRMLEGRGGSKAQIPHNGMHGSMRRKIAAERISSTHAPEDDETRLHRLAECDECAGFSRDLDALISSLWRALPERLGGLRLPEESLSRLETQIGARISSREARRRQTTWLWRIGVAGGALALLTIAFWGRAALTDTQGDRLPPPALAPVPTPLGGQPRNSILVEEPPERVFVENPIFHSQPSISADGTAIVFSSTDPALAPDGDDRQTQIYLLRPEADQLVPVSVSDQGIPADGWSSSPRISGDGDGVVFASVAENLVAGAGTSCPQDGSAHSCSNIYMRDLRDQSTHLISAADDGRPGNGDSYLPEISGDGRWVTYWSQATNLLPNPLGPCPDLRDGARCANLFLHDLQSGETSMIPIGRDLSAEPFTERASISGDGSLLAITLHRSDAVAEGLGIEGETDVYLYRVETQTFEAVNLSGEGVPGVRSSLRGVISASGREIAFASAMGGFARSGAAGDTNVLLRDLVDGSIERVSVPLAGARDEERRSDQFLPFPQVDISGDGRYVLFSSSADDLTEASTGCRFPAILRCNGVYLRDLATKETTLLAPAAPEESFFGDLDISTDGGRAMVQEYLFFCAPEEACSTLWLIDTQSGRRIGLPGGTPVAEDPNGRTSPFLSLHTESSVGTLAFSPTGASIAAGGGDGIVRIWDVASGKLTISLREHDLPVTGLAYGDAGRALYSAARDRSLRAWRLPDATLMYTTREAFGDLSGLDTDSQGNLLAAGSYGRAWVWRITAAGSPSLRETIDLGGGRITSVSISGGGELLALGTSEGSVEIHRMADGRLLLHLGDHPEKIPTLSFSPDGQYLAYGSADGTLNLWGLDGNAEEGLLAEYLLSVQHPAWINAVAFLPNRPVLAYSNLRDEVYLRRIPDGELIGELGTLEGNVVSSLAVSPEGKLLAVGTVGGEIHLWNLDFIATGPERGG